MKYKFTLNPLTLLLLLTAAQAPIQVLANPDKASAASHPVLGKPGPKPKVALVEINSASKAALMKLPGITSPIADQIIQGRPYLTKTHLVTRKILPRTLYDGIKKQIGVAPPALKR